jgi:hypothetical protein
MILRRGLRLVNSTSHYPLLVSHSVVIVNAAALLRLQSFRHYLLHVRCTYTCLMSCIRWFESLYNCKHQDLIVGPIGVQTYNYVLYSSCVGSWLFCFLFNCLFERYPLFISFVHCSALHSPSIFPSFSLCYSFPPFLALSFFLICFSQRQ